MKYVTVAKLFMIKQYNNLKATCEAIIYTVTQTNEAYLILHFHFYKLHTTIKLNYFVHISELILLASNISLCLQVYSSSNITLFLQPFPSFNITLYPQTVPRVQLRS